MCPVWTCNIWGLFIATSRSCQGSGQGHIAQLVIAFHRRRYGRLLVSIDLPLPPIKIKEPIFPNNIILEALRVKDYMAAHPDENCLSAAAKLNLHRKRIAKLIKIADNLPADFIEKIRTCTHRPLLNRLNVNHLFYIAGLPKNEQLREIHRIRIPDQN